MITERGRAERSGARMGLRHASAALLALLLAPRAARAVDPQRRIEQYTRRTWSLEQGLPQSSINDIAQDRDGYLWLATFGGLVRFDGVRSVVYTSAGERGLPSDRVTAVAVDESGALWVGTERDGLAVRRGRTFERVAPDLPNVSVGRLLPAAGGGAWAATDAGLLRVSPQGAVRRFGLEDGLPAQTGMTVARSPDGALWVGTHKGLCRFEGERCRPFYARELDAASVLAISSGRAGTWVGTSRGLWVVEGDALRPVPIRPGVPVRAILEDASGSVWAGFDPGGLVRIRPREEALSESGAAGSLKSLFEDHEGNLWVGTTGTGLVKLSDGRAEGIAVSAGSAAVSTLPIVSDGAGGAFVGTRCEGIAHVTPEGVRMVEERGAPFRECVWSLLRDGDGTLWAGTFGRGLLRRTSDGRIERLAGPATPGRVVRALLRSSKGDLLAGTDDGLFRVDPATRAFSKVAGTEGLEVYEVQEEADGSLWLGTARGLHHLSAAGHRVLSKATGLPNDTVRALVRDPSGVLWIGTYGGGLCRVEGDRVTVFGSRSGLFEDVVSRIVEDASGRFWLTGNRGVTLVSRARLQAVARGGEGPLDAELLDAGDGMRASECNGGGQPAGFLGEDGRFWVPTVDGVAVFDTRRETRNAVAPPVRIEEVVVDGRPVEAAGLVLPPDAHNLEIRFTALSFRRPAKVRFRTRVVGLDPDWTDAGTRRVAYFPYLPPGDFRFEVSAVNEDGVESRQPAALAFARRARFVETRAFPALLVAGALLLSGAGLHAARRVSRAREARLALLVAQRTRELRRLVDITENINRGLHLEEVLDHVYESLQGVIPYDRIGLAVLDRERLVLRALWSRSESRRVEIGAGYEAPLGTSSLGRVLAEGRPRILNDLESYLAEHPESESTRRIVAEGIRSSLTLPLRADGKPVGIVFFSSFRTGTYEAAHALLLEGLVGHLSMIVSKTRLYDDLLTTKARLEEANAELERLATVDALTGLLNRRAFDDALAREMRRAARARAPIAVLMADIDFFKSYNDRNGHSAGDACLREVGGVLAATVQRTGDAVARWGGEEFAAVLADCGPDAARRVGERLRDAVEARRLPHPGAPEGVVTVSVGAASMIPDPDTPADELLRRADAALYAAKGAGRNRTAVA